MATTEVITEEVSYTTLVDGVASAAVNETVRYETTSALQFPQQLVQQKVWDTVADGWVYWSTAALDTDGVEYPGPGTWGVHTSDYRAQTVAFTRVEL